MKSAAEKGRRAPSASLWAALAAGALLGSLLALRNMPASSSAPDASGGGGYAYPDEHAVAVEAGNNARVQELEAKVSSLQAQLKDKERELQGARDKAKSGGGGGANGIVPITVTYQGERRDRWMPQANAEGKLATLLKKIAPDGEVMVAISDHKLLWDWPGPDSDPKCAPECNPGMLQTFLKGVKQSGVTNYVVVVPQLSPEDRDLCKLLDSKGVPNYPAEVKMPDSQKDTGDNHAVSALKFTILSEFLKLGYAVLLSDIDVVVLQNPFKFIYRDVDIECLSDGFDERTAYGYVDGIDDPSMGWARYAQSTRQFAFNSGMFYMRPNNRTLSVMDRVRERLGKEKAWDQSVFNEEIFFLTHGSYKSPGVTVRVMEIFQFVNSKVLFKTLRYREHPMPVMIHINYHPDKHERMKGVIKRYLEGDSTALNHFPGGSEPGS